MTDLAAIPKVLGTMGRLLAAHWPPLLVAACVGMALREGALWAAIEVSDWNSFVAQLLLVAAPLGYLLPVIVMLNVCRGSLPHARAADRATAPDAPTEGRDRRLVDVAVAVLIPFLTVYAALGLHDQDFHRFFNSAAYDEYHQSLGAGFNERLGLYSLQTVLIIVVVSWILRWGLGVIEARTGLFALAFVGALVECYYTGQLVIQVQKMGQDLGVWWDGRAVKVGLEERYSDLLDLLGSLARPFDTIVDVTGQVLGSLELILIVPAAWLTVSAVVLGHKLIPAPSPAHLPTQRLGKIVQEVGDTLFDDLMDRWAVFWHGIRMVFRAGFATIAVFSLIFIIVARTPYWCSHLARWLIGPTETNTYLSFSLLEESFGLALSIVLITPLLAAATEWLVLPAAELIADEGRSTPAERTRTTTTPA